MSGASSCCLVEESERNMKKWVVPWCTSHAGAASLLKLGLEVVPDRSDRWRPSLRQTWVSCWILSYFKYIQERQALGRQIYSKKTTKSHNIAGQHQSCGGSASVATSGAGRPLIPEPGAEAEKHRKTGSRCSSGRWSPVRWWNFSWILMWLESVGSRNPDLWLVETPFRIPSGKLT